MTNAPYDLARQFLLASVATGYPDDDLAELCTDMRGELRDHPGLGPLVEAAAADPDTLRGTYIDVFDRGKDRVSLHETEHGRMRGLGKSRDLADISGFYRAFSLVPESEDDDGAGPGREAYDHLAVELEFYGNLALRHAILAARGDREGCGVIENAQRKFLADHLGRFIGAVASAQSVRESEVYGPLLAWCETLVASECERLGATPAPLDFFADPERDDVSSCGAVHLPVVE